ncbi:hypothetical protein ES703_70008 [subsurface metagenome]
MYRWTTFICSHIDIYIPITLIKDVYHTVIAVDIDFANIANITVAVWITDIYTR